MKTKSRVTLLKNAYGEYWEQVKECVNDNGWIHHDWMMNDSGWLGDCIQMEQSGDYYRPTSLVGLI